MAGNIYSPKLDPVTGFPIHTTPIRQSLPGYTPSTSTKVTEIVLYDGSRKEEFYEWWFAVKTAWNKRKTEEEDKYIRIHEESVNSEYIKLCFEARRENRPIPERPVIPAPPFIPKSEEHFLNFIETKLSGMALVWFRQEHQKYTTEFNTSVAHYQNLIQDQLQRVNLAQQDLQQAQQTARDQNNAQNQERVNQSQITLNQARDIHRQIIQERDSTRNSRFKQFITTFKRTLGENLTKFEKALRIIIQKQAPTENIRAYADSIKSLFTKYEFPQEEVCWPIILGALESYRYQLHVWKVDTLEEWITKIEESESQVVSTINRQKAYREKKKDQPFNKTNNNNNQSTTNTTKPITYCSQCGKRNHKGQDCRTNPPPKPPLAIVQELKTKGETVLITNTDLSSGKGRIHIPLQLQGKPYSALVDTGADISMIDSKLANSLGIPINQQLQTGEQTLHTIAGDTHPSGKVILEFKLGEREYSETFLLVNNLEDTAAPIIAGLDFLSKCRININHDNQIVTSHGKELARFAIPPKSASSEITTQSISHEKSETQDKQSQEITSTSITQNSPINTPTVTPHIFNLLEPAAYEAEVKQIAKNQNLFISDNHWDEMRNKDWLPPPKEFNLTPSISNKDTCPTDKLNEFNKMLDKMRDIPETEREMVQDLIIRNHDIFVISELPEAGMAKLSPITINTEDHAPIFVRPPRYSVKDKDDMKPVIDKLIRTKTIEPDDGPWGSTMVMVRKPGKDIRPCVGYHRTLNPITTTIPYPPPRMEDFLDWANGAVYMFSGDLCSGYHQLLIHPDSRSKLAFFTPFGKFRYRALPMGLKNSQAYFQHGMEETFIDIFWVIVCAYIDDLMARSATIQGFLLHLQTVFNRLRDKQLFLKIGKCQVLPEKVACLGYLITPDGLTVDPDKVSKVTNTRDPTDKDEIRAFTGLTNFYRDFVKNYSKIMLPITSLLGKDVTFEWKDKQIEAFQTIKEKITSPPILIPPKLDKPYIVKVDASAYAVGATLAQLDENNKERPIRFFSKTLLDAETRYPAHEREALAIIKAFKHFRTYLHNGQKITVYTDNAAVKSLFLPNNQLEPSARVLRWITYMQDFDYNIIHRPGKKNLDNDALSRTPIAMTMTTRSQNRKNKAVPATESQKTTTDISGDTSAVQNPPGEISKQENQEDTVKEKAISSDQSTYTPRDIKQLQREDSECNRYIEYLEKKSLPTDPFLATQTVNACNQMQLDDGILYHTWWPQRNNQRQETRLQLVIPTTLKSEILQHYHDSLLGGHMGFNKTYERIQRNYYWINLYKDTKNYIKSCPDCQLAKADKEKQLGLLQPIIPDRIMQQWCMDVHGPLPLTENNNQYIVMFVERFTGWPEAVAVPHQQSSLIAELITKEIICRHGSFEVLTSDKANNLVKSENISKICKEFNIQTRHTTAYHPAANGQVERFFQTLDQILKKYISKHQRDWDIYLPYALAAIRFSINDARQESPAYLLYGRDPSLPIDLELPLPRIEREKLDSSLHHEQIITQIQETCQVVKDNLTKAREKAKQNFDAKHRPNDLKIGDLVLMTKPETEPGKSKKLDFNWKGPYRVIQVKSETNVTVSLLANPQKVQDIHVSRLKKYFIPTDPSKQESQASEDGDTYEIEDILDDQEDEDTTFYKVRFKGFSKRHDLWIPKEGLNAPIILKRYLKNKQASKDKDKIKDKSQSKSKLAGAI